MKRFDLKLLSKYRTQLMGLAMLLILIFHTGIDVNNLNLLRSFKDIGDVGVDIFLLLSGMGLYFSYTKNSNKKQFYQRRVIRILPTFIPVAIVWYTAFTIIFKGKISDIFLGITTLGFWIKGSITWWFISAILVLYLITPFYLDLMNKNSKVISIIFCIIFIIVGLLIRFTSLDKKIDYLLIAICRVPIFLIGLYLGNIIKNKETVYINNKLVYLLFILSLVLSLLIVNPKIVYIPFALKYYVYIVLSISICLIATNIFGKCKNNSFKLLTFLGIYSLEMYLFHEKVLWLLSFSKKIVIIDKYDIILNVFAYIVSMIIAFVWSKIVALIVDKYNS